MSTAPKRIAMGGRLGYILGLAATIAIANAALPSPAVAADPVPPQARVAEATEGAQPAARPKPATAPKATTAPKPANPSAKPRRSQADDNVADELNRREAERRRGQGAAAGKQVAQADQPPATAQVDSPPAAAVPPVPAAEPPIVAAPAAPIEGTALPPPPVVRTGALPSVIADNPPLPTSPAAVGRAPRTAPSSELPRMAQAVPPGAPPPVPQRTLPPAGAGPPGPQEAPARDFGRNAVVGTEQPTLSVETNKAQFVRLRSPANTVFIANPEIADIQVRSPTLIYVYGKRPGTTVLYAVDERERVVLNTVVSVTHEFSRLMSILDRIHPGNKVQFISNNDTIVITGTATSAVVVEDARRLAIQHAGSAARVVNQVRIAGANQVNLRVKVVEVQRGAFKSLGINWNAVGNIGGFVFAAATGAPITNVAGQIIRSGAPLPNIAAAGYRGRNAAVEGLIDALATEGLLTVLAEPNLTAMSGETASFLAGGEFPVPIPQGGTSNNITIEYKQFGVSLAFTPTIIDDRINLRVRPEVSQLSDAGAVSVPLGTGTVTIPALQTRRADTTVELGSGQSFAIAGLLLRTTNQDVSKVPGLGEVPILGLLFKSDRYQRDETELVIIVTPYIVQPSSTALATPIDGFAPPSDQARYLYGQTNTPALPRGASGPYGVGGGRKLAGPGGFIVD
jgi:pilus assembly protein CpaC